MKKLFKVALVAICVVLMGNFANAQAKFGYIDTQALITAMPEMATVNKTIEEFKKGYIDQLDNLKKEYDKSVADYQAKQATMTDAVKAVKQSELNDLAKRAQDYQNTASQAVEAKGAELMKPITDKARAAINEVAKERGCTYVFDAAEIHFLVSPPTDDLLAAVKTKLGLK